MLPAEYDRPGINILLSLWYLPRKKKERKKGGKNRLFSVSSLWRDSNFHGVDSIWAWPRSWWELREFFFKSVRDRISVESLSPLLNDCGHWADRHCT